MPGVTFVLGDTAAEAQERAAEIRRQQVSPQTAILALEQVWGVDLSGVRPGRAAAGHRPGRRLRSSSQGRVRHADPLRDRRQMAGAVGGEGAVHPADRHRDDRAAVLHRHPGGGRRGASTRSCRTDAADGFILVPHLTPGGLDEFVDRVVPLLQERGVFRTEYTGRTLRDHLGLSRPAAPE